MSDDPDDPKPAEPPGEPPCVHETVRDSVARARERLRAIAGERVLPDEPNATPNTGERAPE